MRLRALRKWFISSILWMLSGICAVGAESPFDNAPQETATATVSSQTSYGIGLGISLYQLPEDKDFENVGRPLDLFFDMQYSWGSLRAGYNLSESKTHFSSYKKDWNHQLKNRSFYGAWRFVSQATEQIEVFALVGLVYMNSELQSNNNLGRRDNRGTGYILGSGFFYAMGEWDIGGQAQVISRTGSFGGISIATGSTQILALARYRFSL